MTSPSTANVHTYTHIHTYKIAHTHTFKYTYFHAQHTHSPSSACLACCWLHLNYLTCTHKTHTHAVHQAPVWPAAGCTSILSLAHTKHTHTQSIKRLSGLLLAAPEFSRPVLEGLVTSIGGIDAQLAKVGSAFSLKLL